MWGEEAREEDGRKGGRDGEEEEEAVAAVAVVLRAISWGLGVGREEEEEEEEEEVVVVVAVVLKPISWGLRIPMCVVARSVEIRQTIMATRLSDGGRNQAKDERIEGGDYSNGA